MMRAHEISLRLLLMAANAILSSACSEQQNSSQISAEKKTKNFREIPAWTGVFQDTLPCADCPGLITWLELFPDGKYKRISTRIGFDDVFSNTYSTRGKWQFDIRTGIIRLDFSIEKDRMALIPEGDSILIACDEKGGLIQEGRWKLRKRSGGDGLQVVSEN